MNLQHSPKLSQSLLGEYIPEYKTWFDMPTTSTVYKRIVICTNEETIIPSRDITL